MGDPVGVAAYVGEHLSPDGTMLLAQPFALDGREVDQDPMAALL